MATHWRSPYVLQMEPPDRLYEFAAARLDVLIECRCGHYRYESGEHLAASLSFMGISGGWFPTAYTRLTCPDCKEHGQMTVVAVPMLSLSDRHAEIMRRRALVPSRD